MSVQALKSFRVLFCIGAFIAAFVFLYVALAFAVEPKPVQESFLTATAMWILGGIGTLFLIIGSVLIQHENKITKLQQRPHNFVTEPICNINQEHIKSEMGHGNERFERIERRLEKIETEGKDRHSELISILKDLKN